MTGVLSEKKNAVMECEYLSKAFDGFEVLRNFGFNIREGEILSLLGPSGCGKTTLLRIIAGLECATSGSILIAGRPISGPSPICGVLCQEPVLFPWLTSIDNVLLASTHATTPKKSRHRQALDLLKLVGLYEFARFHPGKLSGGQKRRLGLACCLAANPSLLLMDEPFAGLDELSKLDIRDDFLNVCRNQNLTALIVTHDVEDAIYLSRRIIVLSPRPATVLQDIEVNFKHDRNRSLLLTPEFSDMEHRVRMALRNATIIASDR